MECFPFIRDPVGSSQIWSEWVLNELSMKPRTKMGKNWRTSIFGVCKTGGKHATWSRFQDNEEDLPL